LQSNSVNSNSIVGISWSIPPHSLPCNSPCFEELSLTKSQPSVVLKFASFVSEMLTRFLKNVIGVPIQRLLQRWCSHSTSFMTATLFLVWHQECRFFQSCGNGRVKRERTLLLSWRGDSSGWCTFVQNLVLILCGNLNSNTVQRSQLRKHQTLQKQHAASSAAATP